MKSYYKNGHLFYFPVRFLGYALIVFSIISISQTLLIIFLLLFGFLLSFTTYGTEINQTGNKVRNITSCCFLKFGMWFNLSDFDFVTYRKKRKQVKIYFSSNQFFTKNEDEIEIILTDFLLKKVVVITELKSLKQAEEFAFDWSNKLKIPIKNYSNILSDRKIYFK